MAGAGLVPGQLTYAELCGLYFDRERIQAARRADMAAAIHHGLAGLAGGGE